MSRVSKRQREVLAKLVELGRPATPAEAGTTLRACRCLVRAGYANVEIVGRETVRRDGKTTANELFEANTRAKRLVAGEKTP